MADPVHGGVCLSISPKQKTKMSQTIRVCAAALLFVLAGLHAISAEAQSAKLGKEIFTEKAEPACALCHTLKDAGSTGEIGPDLDELQPDQEMVRNAVKNGVGAMPPFEETLTDAEIAAVARYVAEAVRSGKKH